MRKVRNRLTDRKSGLFWATGAVLFVYCVSLLLPFFWMLFTSFKGLLDYMDGFFKLPQKWQFSNYAKIFDLLRIEQISDGEIYEYKIQHMLLNSFILASTIPFMQLVSPALASYVVAKYKFRGRNFLFALNIFVMTIPIVGSLANTLTVYRQLGIYDNILLYILLPGMPFGFNFLLLYGAYKGIPDSFAEAVRIDGGGHLTVFFRIVIPMMIPTFTALYILGFIGGWNDYSAPLLFLPSNPNLAYGMYVFQQDASRYGANLPEILAGFTMTAIPSVLLFVLTQKIVMRSLRIGGLKE